MRIFLTGGSGWIGSALVPELISAGHQIIALARSDTSANALTAAGVQVHPGTLADVESLRKAAAATDGVIHLAFDHESAFSGGFLNAVADHHGAIDAFGEALAGSDRPLIVASGTGMLRPGKVGTEEDAGDPDGPAGGRVVSEHAALSLAARGVRSSVVRLPPTNYGDGDNGFIATLVAMAGVKGASCYVGAGTNRWPTVHRLDSARLLRLAVEKAPAGSVLHGVAEQGVRIRDIAEAIGRQLDVPAVSISAEEAVEVFGFLGDFLAADIPASSALTRELMGWQPTQPGLIEDISAGHYFTQAAPTQESAAASLAPLLGRSRR